MKSPSNPVAPDDRKEGRKEGSEEGKKAGWRERGGRKRKTAMQMDGHFANSLAKQIWPAYPDRRANICR